jgi:hypothetical protein
MMDLDAGPTEAAVRRDSQNAAWNGPARTNLRISNEEDTPMRKVIILFGLLVAMQAMAEEKSIVTVKSGEVANGVVILTVNEAAQSFTLHCNKGMTECKLLEPGTYTMVRLPKNWGMYDCTDVDLYTSTTDAKSGEKLGEYCLITK